VATLVMGFNHRFGHDRPATREQYVEAGRAVGVDVVFAEPYDGDGGENVCSSAIRTALTAGDVAAANRMLGRPYSLRGKVVGGKQLGRKIGFPTANISTDDSLLIPARGVYAVDVTLDDGEKRRGMLNIGVRPTVDGSVAPVTTLEVNIFDWDGSLYGRKIEVAFLVRLRDERRFDGIEQLKKQLDEDRRAALDV
ncbi:MAG: riboflavin kinase, partial [Muribaculaceae bacterium]